MKRIIDDPDVEGRDLVDALRRRASAIGPAEEAGLFARLKGGARPTPASRVVRPGVLAAGAVAVGSAVVALVLVLAVRPPSPRRLAPRPRAVEQPAEVVEAPRDLLAAAPLPLSPRRRRPPALGLEPAATAVAPPEAEESRLLLEADRALRRDHDAAAAVARVDGYLARYPHGALVEEALVLAFDAADPTLAVDYARRYIALFPEGEHIARARKLAGNSP